MSRNAMIGTLVVLCTGLVLPAAVSAQARGKQSAQTAVASTVRDTSAWRGARPLRAEELLARFPGVEVRQAPGGGVSVRIRGSSSLGNAEPLYVIDGMVVDQLGSGLLGINPTEIARIEVLKDAAATAFYGMRGSNGVVVITSKRGRQ
jgi:TonB-dependent SusC/RagA subfamily outer membrane receptor